MTSFSVADWNVGDAGKGGDLVTIARTADVIALQEAADRDAMMRAFCTANPGWVLFSVDVPGGAHSPVLVDTEAALGAPVNVSTHPAVAARRICPNGQQPKGAGPPVIKPKVITDVEFESGVHVLNTHMIPSVTLSLAKLGRFEYDARRKHFADHIAAIEDVVEYLPDDSPVILCGDFNCEPDFELMQPLHDLGFVGWTVKPTHDTRAIDHVVFLPNRGVTWTATAVLPTASDHAAVVSEFSQEPPVPPVPDPYAHTIFHGKPLDYASVDSLKVSESRLDYELTITQGVGGAKASAGTHTEGRAVDLVDWDTDRKLRVLKDLGWAAWRRPRIAGLWNSHIHAVLSLESRDNQRGLAPAGFRQIGSFDDERDGLKSNAHDPTYRPDPKVNFHYPYEAPVTPPKQTKVSQARDKIVEGLHVVSLASALADEADDKRAPIRKFTARLDAVEAELRAILTDMPKT